MEAFLDLLSRIIHLSHPILPLFQSTLINILQTIINSSKMHGTHSQMRVRVKRPKSLMPQTEFGEEIKVLNAIKGIAFKDQIT